MDLKIIITSHSTFYNYSTEMNSRWHPEISESGHVIYPTGKPMAPHLLRCQGFAVNYYSCTLDANAFRSETKIPLSGGSAAPSTFATIG